MTWSRFGIPTEQAAEIADCPGEWTEDVIIPRVQYAPILERFMADMAAAGVPKPLSFGQWQQQVEQEQQTP